jgi:hypothetical protein
VRVSSCILKFVWQIEAVAEELEEEEAEGAFGKRMFGERNGSRLAWIAGVESRKGSADGGRSQIGRGRLVEDPAAS